MTKAEFGSATSSVSLAISENRSIVGVMLQIPSEFLFRYFEVQIVEGQCSAAPAALVNLKLAALGSQPTFAAAAHEINAKSKSQRRLCGT